MTGGERGFVPGSTVSQPTRLWTPAAGSEEVDIPAEEDFVGNIQNRVLLEQVERWVAGQDTEAQAVFRLHLYGEKTFPEIAAILDKPESAVKSQYYRLLGRLRKEFDPCE